MTDAERELSTDEREALDVILSTGEFETLVQHIEWLLKLERERVRQECEIIHAHHKSYSLKNRRWVCECGYILDTPPVHRNDIPQRFDEHKSQVIRALADRS